jgi:hypothetical protein
MALLRQRFATHAIPPGRAHPLTLADLQQLMRQVRAETEE